MHEEASCTCRILHENACTSNEELHENKETGASRSLPKRRLRSGMKTSRRIAMSTPAIAIMLEDERFLPDNFAIRPVRQEAVAELKQKKTVPGF